MSGLIGAAPDILDTIVEVATALGNDQYYDANMHNQISNKSDNTNTCLNTDADVCLSSLQSGINNRLLMNTLQLNGTCKQHAITHDILKVQQRRWFNVIWFTRAII